MMTINAEAVDGYQFHTQLVNGENAREHQVGLVHEVETLGNGTSSKTNSQ